MHKVRVAKKDFADTAGHKIQAGDPFILVEVRPHFYSRRFLEDALAALDENPEQEPKEQG